MKTEDQPNVYAHLISLGATKRAAGAIGADLNDLADGIAKIESTLLSMEGSVFTEGPPRGSARDRFAPARPALLERGAQKPAETEGRNVRPRLTWRTLSD